MLDRVRSHTQKLKDAVRVCALAAFFFSILCWPLPLLAKDSFPCGTQSQIVRALMAEKQAFVATMIQSQHVVWQLFVNLRTGEWTIILIDDKQTACIIARGYDFQSAAGRDI